MTKSTMHYALEFIDKHITNKYSDIMNALYSKTRHTQKEYATCFHMLTNMSLHRYVTERRIHFICEAIMEKPTYPIKHHALDFGYKNDTAMYKDFKDFAKFTPKSVITDGNMFPDNRISFEVITSGNTLQSSHQEETTMSQEVPATAPTYEIEPPEMFFEAMNDFGYSLNTCHKIADLAEQLGIPFYALAEGCFNTMIDIRSAADFIEPDIERAIDLGIGSYKELESICSYFECKYYELDSTMVDIYRRCHRNNEEVNNE